MKHGRFAGKIAVAPAASYDPGIVAAAVKGVLEPFGGAAGIINRGLENSKQGSETSKRPVKVLVKPNVLRPALPEEAVTTHPEVVKAVCREFIEAGAEVSVGDSPGGDPGPAGPAFEKCGIKGVCSDLDIPLLNFQKHGGCEVELPDCVAGKINIAKPVAEADLVINLPKFKTHTLTQLTCVLKNPYGFIPGFSKGRLHVKAPRLKEFAKIVCAIWEVFPPQFSLVDAILGMEGAGPSSGDPVKVGWLLGGIDPVALDTVVAYAMGFSPGDIVVNKEGNQRGLGVCDLDQIEIINGSLEDLRISGFKLPRVSRFLRWAPRWITIPMSVIMGKLFWARPHVIDEKCEICHRCVRSCPAGAMLAEKSGKDDKTGKKNIPRLALPKACISCMCCQEVCPAKAIEVRKSFVLTRIFRSEEKRMADKEKNC